MSLRDRVLLGIIASGLTLSLFAPSFDPEIRVPDGYVENESQVSDGCIGIGRLER